MATLPSGASMSCPLVGLLTSVLALKWAWALVGSPLNGLAWRFGTVYPAIRTSGTIVQRCSPHGKNNKFGI